MNEKQKEILEDLDTTECKKVIYLLDYVGLDFEDAMERYEDVTLYEDMSMEEVVEQYINECGYLTELPDIIANNIDYKSIAIDWELSGEFDYIDGDTYNFVQ